MEGKPCLNGKPRSCCRLDISMSLIARIQPKNMFESMSGYMWVWKACGVCHLTLCKTGKKKSPFKLKETHSMYFIYALTLFSVTIFTGVQEILTTLEMDTITMTKGIVMFSVDIGFMICVVCSGISSAVYHRRRFSRVLQDLENVERYLQWHLNHRKTADTAPKSIKYAHILAWLPMLVTLGYDWYAWFLIFDDDFRFSYQWTYITYLIATTMIMKFVFVVWYIQQQFYAINSLFVEHLNFIYDQPPRSNLMNARNHMLQSRFRLLNLTHLLRIHDSLYGIIAETSVVFGFENLISLIFILEQLVCCPFYSIVNSGLFDMSKESTQHFIFLYTIWTCSLLVLLFVMVYACSKVKDEAFNLKKIVSRYMNPLKTRYPNDYIHLYLIKLTKRYKGFSVFGIVELDLPLARQMIATAMTYLVIFLQF